jgi:hypothetical protein
MSYLRLRFLPDQITDVHAVRWAKLKRSRKPDAAKGFSSINQEMNLLGQDAGNVSNDVPSEKIDQAVPLRGAND